MLSRLGELIYRAILFCILYYCVMRYGDGDRD